MSKNLSQAHPDNSGPAIVGACDPSRRIKDQRQAAMDWVADDASLGISQYVPSLPSNHQALGEAQTLGGCLRWRGGKYSIPSSLPNRSH
jgi:hypothetical protein